jgi:hypothetical protein
MTFKYTLPDNLIKKAVRFWEFANGGAQATIKLKSGDIYKQALISNSKWIVAMRGYKDLPFAVADIDDIFQTKEDETVERSGRAAWDFWDDWS